MLEVISKADKSRDMLNDRDVLGERMAAAHFFCFAQASF
jgi:hypothetical protein